MPVIRKVKTARNYVIASRFFVASILTLGYSLINLVVHTVSPDWKLM